MFEPLPCCPLAWALDGFDAAPLVSWLDAFEPWERNRHRPTREPLARPARVGVELAPVLSALPDDLRRVRPATWPPGGSTLWKGGVERDDLGAGTWDLAAVILLSRPPAYPDLPPVELLAHRDPRDRYDLTAKRRPDPRTPDLPAVLVRVPSVDHGPNLAPVEL